MKARHPFRGFVAAFFLGPVVIASGLVAFVAFADMFISGWIPSRWFSHSVLDWMFAFGTEGGAADYFIFMAGAMTCYMSYKVIEWAYLGGSPKK